VVARALAFHASGRRSGDQFCVYVADRLVLPRLSPSGIQEIADGRASMDAAVRGFIHEYLGYRFVLVEDGTTARRLEALVRAGALGELPLLNPSVPKA
jgi:hypothetical protein